MKAPANVITRGSFSAPVFSREHPRPRHGSERFRTLGRVPTEIRERTVLIDLHEVTSVDSTGLALFMEAMQGISARGGHLVLFGVRDEVRRVFETAKLDRVFHIFASREEALADQASFGLQPNPALN